VAGTITRQPCPAFCEFDRLIKFTVMPPKSKNPLVFSEWVRKLIIAA
jgi:hypothetical protein